MKIQVPNDKSQIPNNFQFLDSKALLFGALGLFVIWNLVIDDWRSYVSRIVGEIRKIDD